jgi:hypothetical protein
MSPSRSRPPRAPSPIWEKIAGWGTAKLMKDLDNNYQLIGGSDQDRQAAEKWMAVFIWGRNPGHPQADSDHVAAPS